MAVALYMDVHIPRAITLALRLRDVDILTSQEDDTATLDDPLLLDRATSLNRVLFSADADLLAEAHSRQEQGIYFAGVIYAHFMRVSIGDCVNDLELIGKAGDFQDFENKVIYLPL